MPTRFDSSTEEDDESDEHTDDPGQYVIEKNQRNRLQRLANHTRDELNKVLRRVDRVRRRTSRRESGAYDSFLDVEYLRILRSIVVSSAWHDAQRHDAH